MGAGRAVRTGVKGGTIVADGVGGPVGHAGCGGGKERGGGLGRNIGRLGSGVEFVLGDTKFVRPCASSCGGGGIDRRAMRGIDDVRSLDDGRAPLFGNVLSACLVVLEAAAADLFFTIDGFVADCSPSAEVCRDCCGSEDCLSSPTAFSSVLATATFSSRAICGDRCRLGALLDAACSCRDPELLAARPRQSFSEEDGVRISPGESERTCDGDRDRD